MRRIGQNKVIISIGGIIALPKDLSLQMKICNQIVHQSIRSLLQNSNKKKKSSRDQKGVENSKLSLDPKIQLNLQGNYENKITYKKKKQISQKRKEFIFLDTKKKVHDKQPPSRIARPQIITSSKKQKENMARQFQAKKPPSPAVPKMEEESNQKKKGVWKTRKKPAKARKKSQTKTKRRKSSSVL